MAKQIKVVIGANFGDEGKGLMTDYFCKRLSENGSVLNIRFNGGAQAGHTVVVPTLGQQKRHVFSHFGAGSFVNGTDTYLSGNFILNPILFCRERDEMYRNFWFYPKVYIHESCKITTPFDMLVNQIVERSRGDQRHGSCGVGINETVVRYRSYGIGHTITPKTIRSLDLKYLLTYQRDIYLPKRLKELGVSNISLNDLSIILSENIIDNWIAQANEMMDYCHVVNDDIVHDYDGLVFEGAQGLLLDEMYEEFAPYLTTSRTGIPGVNRVLYSAGLYDCRDIEMCFVSRTYFTRHGAGFFPTECSAKDLFGEDKQDATNVWNEFQGSFRYGYFEEDRFRNVCNQEFKRAKRMYPYASIIENANFKQAFEHFENSPIHDVVACRTYFRHRPYICLIGAWFAESVNLYQKDFTSLSIRRISEEDKGVTLEWIMEHLSAEKTIQYLKERGLNICPIRQ